MNKNIDPLGPRTRRPATSDVPSTITTLMDVNSEITQVGTYYDHQYKVYRQCKSDFDSRKPLVIISGMVDTAEVLEKDLDWAKDKLTALYAAKKAFLEANEDHYTSFVFKEFAKPVMK